MNAKTRKALGHVLQERMESLRDISGVKAPRDEKIFTYQDDLLRLEKIRAGSLIYPFFEEGRGRGALVELANGSVKYDLISGVGTHRFGHSRPELIAAELEAALESVCLSGNLQHNRLTLDFSEKLLARANADKKHFKHVFVSSSGVMAGENALKIAFHKKNKSPKNGSASRVLAFERNFFGRTCVASFINDKPAYRVALPKSIDVDYVPFFDYNNPEGSSKKAVEILKKHLWRYPGAHACMVLELIQGEGGFWTAPREFFVEIMSILKDEGVAVLVDEVQTFSRGKNAFMAQELGLQEFIDITWVGKTTQACATIFREEFCPAAGLLAQTYTASNSCLAVGAKILDLLIDRKIFGEDGENMILHRRFTDFFTKMGVKCLAPHGHGAMIAFEPEDSSPEGAFKLCTRLFEKGVICLTSGKDPTRIRFLPPADCLQEEDLEEIFAIIASCL